jgi:histidinol-phosphate aminotransferase
VNGVSNFVIPSPKVSPASGVQRPDWTSTAFRDPRLLWLDKNENTDPVLQAVVFRALAEMDPQSVMTYPDAVPLYHKLAEYLCVTPQSLMLAQGSDGVIGSVFRAFVEPGDVVLLTDPTYAMYQVYCGMYGAETAKLEYTPGETGPFLRTETVIGEIRKRRPKLKAPLKQVP